MTDPNLQDLYAAEREEDQLEAEFEEFEMNLLDDIASNQETAFEVAGFLPESFYLAVENNNLEQIRELWESAKEAYIKFEWEAR